MEMLGDRVEVLIDPLIKEKGGIVLPERMEEVSQWGAVVGAGPDCVDLKPGDRVMFSSTSGTRFKNGEKSMLIIREADVLLRRIA